MQDRLGTSPAYQLIHTFWTAVDWIFPPRCGGCHSASERWCSACESQTIKIDERSSCPVCGIPQADFNVCSNCKFDRPPYSALRSWAVYDGPVREAIHQLKYHSDLGLSEIFAQKLRSMLISRNWKIDLVTVVPLGRGRLKERGFNQADLLARTLAYSLHLPYHPKAILRVRETQSQVGLNALERHQNVNNAFQANPGLIQNKRILVIDDVTTTGATLSECARACLQVGAHCVYGMTIARAVLENSA